MKKIHPFVAGLIVILLLTLPFLFMEKGFVVLWLNQRHTAFADLFFKNATYLGDGLTVAVFGIVLLLFVSYYKTIVFTVAIAVDSLFINVVGKHWLFSHLERPKKYFDESVVLNFVEGVKVHGSHAFPSGHTGAAFVWLSFLAFLVNKKLGLVFLFVALLVALSRMYLLQHFLMDVYAGSIIGTGAVLLAWWFFDTKTKLSQKPSWNRSLLIRKAKAV
jgi:membrane-associated phospholipid phosphatase